MSDQNYFAADREFTVERDRLVALERSSDPVSINHLERLGVAPGWHCLDVGAGAGSIGRWLAERVGAEGKVVVTDINPRFLGSDRANLIVRQHNILTDELEEDAYDLVHCRLVFSHLNSSQKALQRMAAALRPGGWLLIRDADWSFFKALDPEHSSSDFYDSFVRSLVRAGAVSGSLDPCCGGRLFERLERVGLIEVGNEARLSAQHGGSDGARGYIRAVDLWAPRFIPTGLVTLQDINRFKALMEDPTFYYSTTASFVAWGRRPL